MPKETHNTEELVAVAAPVIAFLRKYYNPHAKVIIDINSAEVVEGVTSTGDLDDHDLVALGAVSYATYMHFMSISESGPRECFTVAELEESKVAAPITDVVYYNAYVAPMNALGDYHNYYRADICKRGDPALPQQIETVTFKRTLVDNKVWLCAKIAGCDVVFKARDNVADNLIYAGEEDDPGFDTMMREMVPVPEDSLDTLLEQTGYVIIGRAQPDPEGKTTDGTAKA